MKKLITTGILSIFIAVGAYAQNCAASFTHSTTPANPAMVMFNNTSTVTNLPGNYISYDWYFGDGNSSSAFNPTHTYNAAGSYTVCLIVGVQDTAGGSWLCVDSVCTTVTITLGNPNPISCNASFFPDSSSSNASGIFVYNNSTPVASGTATVSYYWDFGDGNTANTQYPTHQYASSGIYNVCLTIVVMDSGVTCTDTFCMPLGVDSVGNVFFKTNGPGFSLNVKDPATIGLNENLLSGVELYPNPVSDKVSIDLGTQIDGAVKWSIRDLKGSVLATGEFTEMTSEIDVQAINSGFYILTVESGEASSNHKFQIVR